MFIIIMCYELMILKVILCVTEFNFKLIHNIFEYNLLFSQIISHWRFKFLHALIYVSLVNRELVVRKICLLIFYYFSSLNFIKRV